MKRVAIAGFLHESNTFLSVPTTIENFRDTSWSEGREIVRRWADTHHELGGMLQGCAEERLESVPLVATYAVPSGAITSETFSQIADALISSLRREMPVDGILLALHGATAASDCRDADGEITRRVRQVVGPGIPVVMTLDLHANISERMIANTDAAITYRSNPHLDQRERGIEAARLLAATLRGEVQPVQAVETPPWIIPICRQYTAEHPVRGLYDFADEIRQWPGILAVNIGLGFYYADVEEMGAAFSVVADRDTALARKAARAIATHAWERRHEFTNNLMSPADAVRHVARAAATPVGLFDVGDNVGGGSPADSTILFQEVLRQGVSNALVILYDPEAVAACVQAGVRSEVDLPVGAKTDGMHGRPIKLRGRVRTIGDGLFFEREARHGGWGAGDQGVTVVVETAESHTIVLTSRRMAPFYLQQIRSLGVDPAAKRILIVKGVVAPRAAYAPVCAEIVLVDTPGVTANDPRCFSYKHRRPEMFPLEPRAVYSPATE
jgi:microcystin degradation protein MlrC